MKKAMISQPMGGLSDKTIKLVRDLALEELKKLGYEVINTLFVGEWNSLDNLKRRCVVQIPLYFLARSIDAMCFCNAVYFVRGWENARGCRIEHDVAVAYGLEIIYEQ